jgi:hypothetical protein
LVWAGELRPQLCREVLHRNRPEFIHEAGPLLVLALPLDQDAPLVALGAFLTSAEFTPSEAREAAEAFETTVEQFEQWARRQTPIAAATLERISQLSMAHRASTRRATSLEREVEQLSHHLCGTYEEISLIYLLADNLALSRHESNLGEKALKWLYDLVPAEGLVLERRRDKVDASQGPDGDAAWDTFGECPLDHEGFRELLRSLHMEARGGDSYRPTVINRTPQGRSWANTQLKQLVLVPLCEGETHYGWLGALNHRSGGEFGTVEANLLSSVAAILGIHQGNQRLFLEQAELLANIVHALTSAIDAKDQYTRGHSDRVARVSMRLARELGCDRRTIETIYLSGLLHDVGKIGIDDAVLRKPGRLTAKEFEHIRLHPQLGYNILVGIKQLAPVLPVVLHHHEAWDGSGYPHGLAGKEIPYLARIAAVADSFDAMGSDRPYRLGMNDAQLDAIIRAGAGKQWDPDVVAAFFRARDDIRGISRGEAGSGAPVLSQCFGALTELSM